MEELTTIMNLLRNVSSAVRLVENYIAYGSTPAANDLYQKAFERLKTIENNSHEITKLVLELQRKAQPR